MISKSIHKILFFDLETVGLEKDFQTLTEKHPEIAKQFQKYEEWFKKRYPEDSQLTIDELYLSKGGLLPEFAKIIVGTFAFIAPDGEIRKQTFADDDEVRLLKDIKTLLTRLNKIDFYLCGHNIKLFDIPMLAKRMIINGMKPPEILPAYDTKPWEVKAIDTKDFWQYGNNFSIATLELMCASLGVDSSKTGDVTGSNVHDYYWNKDGLKQISEYCEKDVDVLIDVMNKLNNLE
jgi:DNA polymerase elongation subunit (family B)